MEKPEGTAQELRNSIENKLRAGEKLQDVQVELIQSGMDEPLAREVLAKVAKTMWTDEKFIWDKKLKSGAILLGIGAIITVGSYSLASGGGVYLLAWGPIIVGLIRCFEASSKSGNCRIKIQEVDRYQDPAKTKDGNISEN